MIGPAASSNAPPGKGPAPILRDTASLRAAVAAWKRAGASVGVVPTMGALHEGHLSLVRAARAACDRLIVTIFVNPRQFGSAEDLAKYPRTEEADARLLARHDVDAIFAPGAEAMYPPGFATSVTVGGVAEGLCGAGRPGHFDGVATVVTKLFNMTAADRAFFGEKDWQQIQVVRRVVADLDLPLAITACPTVRDADGLAMSSRNVRLTPAGRAAAPALHAAMQAAAAAMRGGVPAAAALAKARAAVLAAGYERVEYLELRAAEGLATLDAPTVPARLLAAAWIDGVRLIDNIAV